MASTYTFKLHKTSELLHTYLASEKEHGIQAYIFRDYRKPQEEFSVHTPTVEALYGERPPETTRDMVFLTVASPGKAFVNYNDEKNKIAMTLKSYLELLKFFNKEYYCLVKRMDSDVKNMAAHSEWFKLNPFLAFRGPGDIQFKHILDATSKVTLELMMNREFDTNYLVTKISYSNEKLGSLHLPLTAITQLAKDGAAIGELMDYKETGAVKRPRQF